MSDDESPVYIPHCNDCFRLNTFVHICLADQDNGTTTICQLFKDHGRVSLRLFYPLFPQKKLRCHPDIPPHSANKLLEGVGCENVELYKSNQRIVARNLNAKEIKIRFPAFVFSIEEFQDPANAWAHGLSNVFIVWYKEPPVSPNDSSPSLVPIEPKEIECFPMDYRPEYNPIELCVPPRCFHRNVWTGLFLLRKGLSKILNKRGHQSEEIDLQSLNIGAVPMETFNYIFVVANSNCSSILCEQNNKTESYLQVDSRLTRSKIKMSYENGILRFQTPSDIDIIRRLLGITAVYGSCES